MKNNWIYQDKEILTEDDIPIDKAVGFIYIITQLSTGKRYLGRKLLTKSSSKQVGGVKKKTRKPSNWRNYWSSSPKIKEWIKNAGGTNDFKREILLFVTSKSELLYAEECLLYHCNTMLSNDWINDNIRSRIMKSWFCKNGEKFLLDINQIRSILC